MNVETLEAILGRKRKARKLPSLVARRSLREAAGLTQMELAALLEVNRAAISRWETGTRAPAAKLRDKYLAILDRLAVEVAK